MRTLERSKGGKTVTGARGSFSREAVGVKSIFSFFLIFFKYYAASSPCTEGQVPNKLGTSRRDLLRREERIESLRRRTRRKLSTIFFGEKIPARAKAEIFLYAVELS